MRAESFVTPRNSANSSKDQYESFASEVVVMMFMLSDSRGLRITHKPLLSATGYFLALSSTRILLVL